jgi:hypothetical protein
LKSLGAGGNIIDLVHDIHAIDDIAEDAVTVAVGGIGLVEEGVVLDVDEKLGVALFGSLVRAMANVPRSLRSPLYDSLGIGCPVCLSRILGSMPPPWIMKSGITR